MIVSLLFRSIVLLYWLLGITGFFYCLLHIRTTPKSVRTFTSLALLCFVFMISWRLLMTKYSSSRYSMNLYLILSSMGSIMFFCLFRKKGKGVYRAIALIVVLTGYLLFITHNPYRSYLKDSRALIDKYDSSAQTALVYVDEKPKKILNFKTVFYNDIPLYELGDHLQNAMNHFKYSLRSFFILTPQVQKNNSSSFRRIGSFKKNKHNKYMNVYLCSNDALPSPQIQECKSFQPNMNKDNLIVNGEFETPYSPGTVYGYIDQTDRKGVIPKDKLFPAYFDIRWTPGFAEDSKAKMYLTGQPTIGGRNSLYIRCNSLVGILVSRSIDKGNYRFECDFISLSRVSPGIQLSLRDENGVFLGFREFNHATINSKGMYHFRFDITNEMVAPSSSFFVCLCFYESNELILDNICLTAQ